MQKNQSKPAVLLIVMLAVLTLLTSCNRGYGCPGDASVSVDVSGIIHSIGSILGF